MVVEVVTLTLPNEAVFFYLCKLAIQQTLSPLYNWFYIDFLGAKVEYNNKKIFFKQLIKLNLLV